MIASDMMFDFGVGFWVKLSDEDIADFEVLRDIAMATIFWLSIYGVHIGATESCICAHDDQRDNPRQATGGSTVSCIKCDRCWNLD